MVNEMQPVGRALPALCSVLPLTINLPAPVTKTIPNISRLYLHWDQTTASESIEDVTMNHTDKQQPPQTPSHQQSAYPDKHPQPLQQGAHPTHRLQNPACPDQHPQLLQQGACWDYLPIFLLLQSVSAIPLPQPIHRSTDDICWNEEVEWARYYKTAIIMRDNLPSMYDNGPGTSKYGFRDKNGITGLFAMNGADIVYTANWVVFIDIRNGFLYMPKGQPATDPSDSLDTFLSIVNG
ncbi:hypothetical protein AUP68_06528 [Ilyonectria robusta]